MGLPILPSPMNPTSIFSVLRLSAGRDSHDDIDRLERFLVEDGLLSLAGDADDRDRIGQRRVEARDHVGAGRPRRPDGEADLAGGTGVAVGVVNGTLLVADGEVLDA